MVTIVEVLQRCRVCDGATRVLCEDAYMTMDGRMVHHEWVDDIDHNRSDCERLVTLAREQWPTLW